MRLPEIIKIQDARPATDGAGVKINRMSGFDPERSMDPFLMLDEIRSERREEFVAGFPPHPHRGFETVTYMLEGGFSHTDSMGNTGTINDGGAQWMTAGSGVIHSEMPGPDAERIHGFQFWLNLPAAEKMQPPAYRDIQSHEVVTHAARAASVRLIAGSLTVDGAAVTGAVTGKSTRPLIADVKLKAQAALSTSADLSLLFYVYQGAVVAGGQSVTAGQLAYLGDGERIELSSDGESGLLLFGGRPLDEHLAPSARVASARVTEAPGCSATYTR